jgi:hypothetical protein
MGGFGSGRPSGSGRDKVEACRSIDINRLHKTGCLGAGWSGGWQWTRDGERVAWITQLQPASAPRVLRGGNPMLATKARHFIADSAIFQDYHRRSR